jgi:hypothetical protein
METTTATPAITISAVEIPTGTAHVFSDGNAIVTYVDSSAISNWQWTPQFFSVTYKSSKTVYFYHGIPFTTIVGLLATQSVGKFIATEIKAKFPVAHQS